MKWTATHRIVFIPHDDAHRQVWMVMLFKDPYSDEYLTGVTEEEMRKEAVPTWVYRKADATWLWRGLPHPHGKRGDIEVTQLDGAAEPITLRYSKKKSGVFQMPVPV